MSNLPLLLIPFGLQHTLTPLQHPIHRACSSLLDFLMPSRSFNVQSAALAHPFWTSAYLNSASTSNPPCLLIPFGLPRAVSPLQRPIHRACSSLLDFLVPYLRFNVQFTVLAHPFWTSSCRISASTSNSPCIHLPHKRESNSSLQSAQSRGPPDLVRPCPKTRLRHVLSINKTPLWSIGKRERRSSRFLTPFFLWTRGESNPCPKTHSLFFYYHS